MSRVCKLKDGARRTDRVGSTEHFVAFENIVLQRSGRRRARCDESYANVDASSSHGQLVMSHVTLRAWQGVTAVPVPVRYGKSRQLLHQYT